MTTWRRRSVEVLSQTASPLSGELRRKFRQEKTWPSAVLNIPAAANLRTGGRDFPTSPFKKRNFTPRNYAAPLKTECNYVGFLPWCLSVVWHCISTPKILDLHDMEKSFSEAHLLFAGCATGNSDPA